MGSSKLHGIGGGMQWPNRPPRDLAIRLADALQYESCDPEDIWGEIEDWMNQNLVAPPDISPVGLIAQDNVPYGCTKFPPITQKSSPMQITRLAYASKHKGLSHQSVEAFLQHVQTGSMRNSVTGVLVVGVNYFLQFIEGSRADINRCLTRIMQDRSHEDIQVISCGDASRRLFQDWNMQVIEASSIKREIVSCYEVDGAFDPSTLSEFAVEDFFRSIADGNWRVETSRVPLAKRILHCVR